MSLVVFALGLGAAALAARDAGIAGKGVISKTGPSYDLLLTNTGSQPLRCMRWFAPSGTTVTSARGAGSTSSFGSGFGAQNLSIAHNGSATFTFRTSKPLAAGANGSLHISADCVKDFTGVLSGPAPPVVRPRPKPPHRTTTTTRTTTTGTTTKKSQTTVSPTTTAETTTAETTTTATTPAGTTTGGGGGGGFPGWAIVVIVVGVGVIVIGGIVIQRGREDGRDGEGVVYPDYSAPSVPEGGGDDEGLPLPPLRPTVPQVGYGEEPVVELPPPLQGEDGEPDQPEDPGTGTDTREDEPPDKDAQPEE